MTFFCITSFAGPVTARYPSLFYQSVTNRFNFYPADKFSNEHRHHVPGHGGFSVQKIPPYSAGQMADGGSEGDPGGPGVSSDVSSVGREAVNSIPGSQAHIQLLAVDATKRAHRSVIRLHEICDICPPPHSLGHLPLAPELPWRTPAVLDLTQP